MRDLPNLFQQLPYFVSAHNLAGKLIWSNRISYGLDASILDQPADAIVLDEDKPIWWAAFRRVVREKEIVDYSLRVVVPDPPGYVQIDGKLSPYLHRGRVKYVIATCHDVTLRNKANPLARFVLSPMGKRVVAYLRTVGAAKGPIIGRHIGEVGSNGQASPKLRASLADKVERGILNHVNGGYSITPEFAPYAATLSQ